MTFDIKVSLIAPNGYPINQRIFRYSQEVEARDKEDTILMILDKGYYETYADYEKTYDAISKILQGYEYSLLPKGRKIETPYNQDWMKRKRI